jgi:hypothetical protein
MPTAGPGWSVLPGSIGRGSRSVRTTRARARTALPDTTGLDEARSCGLGVATHPLRPAKASTKMTQLTTDSRLVLSESDRGAAETLASCAKRKPGTEAVLRRTCTATAQGAPLTRLSSRGDALDCVAQNRLVRVHPAALRSPSSPLGCSHAWTPRPTSVRLPSKRVGPGCRARPQPSQATTSRISSRFGRRCSPCTRRTALRDAAVSGTCGPHP